MKRSLMVLTLAAATLVVAPIAHATLIDLFVNLNGANEVPAVITAGMGTATFELDTVAETLHGHIVFSGLNSNTAAAHIHCCLLSPFATGVNVGVATVVPAFPGFPLGVTSGVDDFTLFLNQASAYNPAFVTAQGSISAAESAFMAGLISGRTYLNIHTQTSPGGEIRGFVQVQVPEPATLSLLALGLAAAGFAARRRKLA